MTSSSSTAAHHTASSAQAADAAVNHSSILSGRPKRLVPSVVASVVERIVGGEFELDNLLPTEAEFVAEYGVSRTVVRESIRVLEEKGLVESLQGKGTYVCPRSEWNLLDGLVISTLVANDPSRAATTNIVAVRAAVEGAALDGIAVPLDVDLRGALEALLAEGADSMQDPKRFLDVDRRFHDLLLAASGNEFARATAHALRSWAGNPSEYVLGMESLLGHSQSEHEQILSALKDGQRDVASRALRAHILDSWTRIKSHVLGGAVLRS